MATAKLELLADSRQIRTADRDLERINKTGRGTELTISKLGLAFTALGGAAAIGFAINSVRQFETALLGVAKTTGLAGQELNDFAQGISAISLRIPVSTAELLELAQAAGQMGVTGSENLEKFSVTVAKLGRASDLAGAEAATALARILNVTGENIESIDTLASVIVSLGNNVAATESEIARMTTEVARATSVFGVSSSEAAGLAAAMTSIGIRAELGGSSVGRAMQEITSAVQEGGERLDKFANTLGLNGERLAEAFEQDKLAAFQMFLAAVGELGLDAGNALESVGLGGQEIAKTIVPLSGNIDILTRTLGLASDEVENATALDKEFEATLSSLDSQIQISRNAVAQFGKEFGSELTPSITASLKAFNEWAAEGDNLAEAADTLISAGTLVATVFGARLVGALAASAKEKITNVTANVKLLKSEASLASSAQARAIQEQAAAKRSLAMASNDALRAGAITRLAIANGKVTATTNAATIATERYAASATAAGIATRGLAAAKALVGGPAGVAILAAGAIYQFSQRNRESLTEVESHTERVARLREELGLLADQQGRNAKEELENIQETSRARGNEIRDRLREIQEQRGIANEILQEVLSGDESRLDEMPDVARLARESTELRGELSDLDRAYADAARALQAYKKELKEAEERSNSTGESASVMSDQYQKVAQSLEDQIYQLQEEAGQLGENAASYDLMIAARQAGVELGSEEAEQLADLIARRDRLNASIREGAEAERDKARAKRESQEFRREQEETRTEFGGLQGELDIENSDDPQAARLEAQLNERLALIDEYRLTKEANQEAADAAELAAFSALEAEKTRIEQAEQETRKRDQLQQLDSTAQFFGQAADLAKSAGKEGFESYKAFATAQAVIGTYSSAVKAYDSLAGIPVVGPALGAAAAATAIAFGLQQVAAINKSQPSARAIGGNVYGGEEYLVGERGPEVVRMQGNGNVTPYNQLMREARNGDTNNRTTNANISFTLPEGNSDFRNRIADNRDLIYNVVAEVMNDRGMRF